MSNLGDTIIWSDVDILLLQNPMPIIMSFIRSADVCGISENHNRNYINGGFFVIKCSEKTVTLWQEIANDPKNQGYYEQDATNKHINQRRDIKLAILPDSFWCNHRGQRPTNTILFHATQLFDPQSKFTKMKDVLREQSSKAILAADQILYETQMQSMSCGSDAMIPDKQTSPLH